jgi:hypothetical protein
MEYVIVFGLLAAFGLWAGSNVHRKANAQKPLNGGPVGNAAHYLAASIACTTLLLIVAALVLRLAAGTYATICVSLLGTQILMLVIYAVSSRGAKSSST